MIKHLIICPFHKTSIVKCYYGGYSFFKGQMFWKSICKKINSFSQFIFALLNNRRENNTTFCFVKLDKRIHTHTNTHTVGGKRGRGECNRVTGSWGHLIFYIFYFWDYDYSISLFPICLPDNFHILPLALFEIHILYFFIVSACIYVYKIYS